MTASHTDSAAYEVGYGKPPRHTQFQKGRSGNPGGRPRKPPAMRLKELAIKEAYRSVVVTDYGMAVTVPAIQAVLRSQMELAAAGNVRAQRAILAMIHDIERADAITAEAAALWGTVNEYAGDDHDIDDDQDVDVDGEDENDHVAPVPQADETGTDGDAQHTRAAAQPSTGSAPAPEDATPPPAGQQPSCDPMQEETTEDEGRSQEGNGGEGASPAGTPPDNARASRRHSGSPLGAAGSRPSAERERLARPTAARRRRSSGPERQDARAPNRPAREGRKNKNSLLHSLFSGKGEHCVHQVLEDRGLGTGPCTRRVHAIAV
jgi:hypothetical protein